MERCPECGLTWEEAAPQALRRKRWRENRRAALIAAGVALGLMLPVVAWLLMPNVGLPFGYYGRYNRAVRAVESVPGLQLGQANANHDVTLEEIMITARLAGGERVRIFVPQGVDLERAGHVVICAMDDVSFGSSGLAPDWSGLVMSLGTEGSLARVTGGRAESVAELLAHVDVVRGWIESADVAELQAEFEPGELPTDGVWMWIGKGR